MSISNKKEKIGDVKSIGISFFIFLLIFFLGCDSEKKKTTPIEKNAKSDSLIIDKKEKTETVNFTGDAPTIHIMVALCDNKYQGIVPVPKKIGNGRDPKNNLYWGTAYGIKTYFKKSNEWNLIRKENKDDIILERLVFKHREKNYYLVADAYDGKFIKKTTIDFLKSNAGILKDTIQIKDTTIGIKGHSNLIAYIGHDGLMDFQLDETYENVDGQKRDAIILACYSKSYFQNYMNNTQSRPLVWTTGLMAPEAYTIHDALTGYINNETPEEIRTRAAKAYSIYQKCSLKAARNLLVSQ